MKEFIISTDSVSDLSVDYIISNNIDIHPLNYVIDGIEYGYGTKELKIVDFYQSMKEGKLPTTCASNPFYIKEKMKKQVLKGYEILHISFSSGLSSSYNNAVICANEIMEEIDGSNIIVVDSLSATVSLGLLVNKAVEMKKKGLSIHEIEMWIEENKKNIISEFVVKDLFHLARGGRLSKSKAYVGTALNIRPILKLDDEGKITMVKRERGHKKSLNALVKGIKDNVVDREIGSVYISHADALDDAEYIAEKIKEMYDVKNIMINNICPTIGAHIGANSLVLAYVGQKR